MHISQFTIRQAYTIYCALAIMLCAMFFSSCKKDKIPPPTLSYNYFPTEKGSFVIYSVDSIVHGDNDNNTDDSVYYYHYQLKDIIDTPFTDLEGRVRQIIVRFHRADSASSWSLRNVYSQLLLPSSAYRWEDNITYHKLAFPINFTQEWDGNGLNTLDEMIFMYDEIHSPKTFNSLSFDSTITVVQRDEDDNIVERIYDTEVYANHVGMIFKQSDNLRKNAGIIVSGTEYSMVVLGYGRE